jgi:hypothetical protein
MSWGRKLEALQITLFGDQEQRDLLAAVQEGEAAAGDWYADHNQPPTRAELLQMGLNAESGDLAAFAGGFITTDAHTKHEKK